MIGLVGRNKRRYGGYIVHVGIVLMFLGFAGEGFKQEEQLLLKPGEEPTVGRLHACAIDAIRVTDDGQKQMVTAHVTVIDATARRSARCTRRSGSSASTRRSRRPRWRSGAAFAEDLYIVLPAFDVEEQSATLEVIINPLVNWIWLGLRHHGARHRHRAAARERLRLRGREAAGRARPPRRCCCCRCCSRRRVARAQHVEEPQNSQMQVSSKETREVAKKLACWCGGCSKLPVGECTCGHCAIEKTKIAGMLKDGQTEQDILDHYVAAFGGQHILSEPLNQGIGRMVWLVPYLAGLGGLLAAFLVAVRWSRKPVMAGATGTGYRRGRPRWRPGWTMSSETSTNAAVTQMTQTSEPADPFLQPWQFFLLGGMLAATATVIVATGQTPANIIMLSLTVVAVSFVGLGVYRSLLPLVSADPMDAPTLIGGRTRAALEREKALVLRSIKELEFDFAMGKMSKADFDDMGGRLRRRAVGLMRQLDAGSGYREQIEKELEQRLGEPAAAAAKVEHRCTCGTLNDPDARFCKSCGSKL